MKKNFYKSVHLPTSNFLFSSATAFLLSSALLLTSLASHAQTVIGGVNLGNLPNYLFFFANGSSEANWQGATKGFAGNIAIDGIQANEKTSGSVPFAGTIYTNASTLGAWASIIDQNDPGQVNPAQAFGVTNQTTLIANLETDLNNAFSQINALPVSSGFSGVSSTSLNGLNKQNGVAETFVINITSGLQISTKINITGDAGDVFILRWDSDGNPNNGYQGQVKFQSGGAVVPLGGLKPSNFINVAGDINSSGGGSTPAAPYPQGPKLNDGAGATIVNGASFSGGGFFTGYWLTTGSPSNGETSPFSNGVFVGGWYTTTSKFSMTSGTSGVYVSPPNVGSSCTVCNTIPPAYTQCTPPTSGYAADITISGNTTWGAVLGSFDHQNLTQKIRIKGSGILTVTNGNVKLANSSAMLVIDGPEFRINNGNLQTEPGAIFIFANGILRTSGNIQQVGGFLCITNSEVEVGDEQAGGTFNTTGNQYTSANFQNDGGKRYLNSVCMNVTHDYQLQSSSGGEDLLIDVCAEIGDQGPNHARTGILDGQDSGNFQNSKNMKIYDSEFIVIENVQSQSSSSLLTCDVAYRTINGGFQNSGSLTGCELCIWVDDQHLIQNNGGSWTASLDGRRGGTQGSIPNLPPNSSAIEIAGCFDPNCCASDPCASQGGDTDGDGVCNNQDCQPNNPAFPATPGSSCNDGNPNTTNDVVTADGCACQGTPAGPDCVNGISITTSNGTIIVTGLDGAPVSSLQVFTSTWQPVFNCFANCGASQTVPVPAGSYFVFAKYYTAGFQFICEKQLTVTVNGGDPCAAQGGDSDGDGTCNNQDCQPNNPAFPATPGSSCNDGNPNTTNDVVSANGCACAGTPVNPCASQGGDTDGDGICNNQDCAPSDPNFPKPAGTACNDGNSNTTNDVIQADGCSCAGTPGGGTPDCVNGISITVGNGVINVTGLNGAPVSSLQVFSSTWQQLFNCFGNCGASQSIPVPAGSYFVFAKYFNASYQLICEKQLTVTVGGTPVCDNITNGGSVGFGTGCSSSLLHCPSTGAVPTIGNCTSPSGGTGNLEIVWLKSHTSCTVPTSTAAQIAAGLDPHWTMIPGATSLSFSPGTVTQNTCYLRCARRAGCPNFIESNIVTLTISSNCNGGGGTPDCANIGITTGNGSITVSGIAGAPVTSVQIFSASWATVHSCFANCASPTATFPVSPGAYYVYVKYYTAGYQLICEKQQTVNVVIAAQGYQGEAFQLDAIKGEEFTELYWVHNGGYHVEQYILERSADGIEFEPIRAHVSEGSQSHEFYQDYDIEPLTGDNFYRVKMVNTDGSLTYSEVQKVNFPDLVDYMIFPNPANDFAKLNLETVVGKKDVTITIFNTLGLEVKRFELEEVWSKYYQMDIRELKEGHYIVWLNVPGKRALAKSMFVGKK